MRESFLSRGTNIKHTWLVLAFLISLLSMSIYYFFFGKDIPNKIGVILGSFIASIIAVSIQFFFSWVEHKKIEKFNNMGFLDVIENRKDRKSYYATLLEKPRTQIDIIANTAKDFLYDFAMTEGAPHSEDKCLITALQGGVNIRFLVAPKDSLSTKKKKELDEAIAKINQLKKMEQNVNAGSINIKYLSTPPTHTFVRVDNKCIFGPIFPEVDSEYTPAILANVNSPFLDQYLKHFDKQWNKRNKKISK